MASHGVYSVTLDEAIEAMRVTAADMSVKYKETSLSVRIGIILRSLNRLTPRIFVGTRGAFSFQPVPSPAL